MNNSKLAHTWANKIKETGKGSNMFFEGDAIYSYGRHFKIATFVTVGENTFVAFNEKSYSNSTAKHKNHVRNAIPSNYRVIYCVNLDFGYYGHTENLKYYISKATEHLKKCYSSRLYKENELSSCKGYLNTVNNYIQLFNLNENDYKDILFAYSNLLAESNQFENSDIYINWLKKQENNKIEKNKKLLIEQAENIVKFREFKLNYVYSLNYNLLRYNAEKNEVQTSGGVNMAKDIFVKYYNKFKANSIEIGERVEHYQYGGQLDNVVFVGCHKFEVEEIENLINSIN